MLIKRGYVMKKETLTLRFKGENDIDIETLSKSLDCVVAVLGKIADSSISENDFCKFKVKNIEKGSFMITIEQIVEMDKEDLMRTRNPIDVESLNGDITEQEATGVLTVRKPDLLGNSKWQFKFLGKTINADIEDENFLKKVKEKEISFPLVSKLNAKMRVRLKNGDPISYTVIEVKSYE